MYSSLLPPGSNLNPSDYRVVNNGFSADDLSVAFLIKYVGTEESGTVTVSSGDIQLKHGDVSSEAADTTVGSNTAGSVDISDTDEDTVAEALALINQSDNWIAVAVDAWGDQAIGTSAELLTMSATQAKVPKGIQVLWDTSAKLASYILIAPQVLREDIRPYQTSENAVDNMLPFDGFAAKVNSYVSKFTNASDDTVIAFYEDEDPTSASGEKLVRTQASGATTVEQVVDLTRAPLESARSKRLIARASGTAHAVSYFLVNGEFYRKLV